MKFNIGEIMALGHNALMGNRTTKIHISHGVVHDVPNDLRDVLLAHPKMLEAWEDITPLARNEFICWIEDAKKPETRAKRIDVAQDKLEKGERRPCCWPGCRHR